MAKRTWSTLEKLLEMQINKESFVVVETLDQEEYDKGHIPGAINIPSAKIARLAKEQIDKDQTIIVYCANYACEASSIAAKKLLDTGYEKVLDFKGGKKAWTDAGLDLEK